MRRNQSALLIALGLDNFGSGLFLPLALVYVTRVVGLPLATAGTVIAAGTMVGLIVPPIAGRVVDRIGPRCVVIFAQLLQGVGALTYLVARNVIEVAPAAMLLAAGQQLFYSGLFSLISDVAGQGAKDRPFAVVSMVRSACFGLGGLTAGLILSSAGPSGYRIAVAADAASFVACGLVLALLVHAPHPHRQREVTAKVRNERLLGDKLFLTLIATTGLVALSVDFFLSGISVYFLAQLHAQPWLPGTAVALLTGLTSVGGTLAVRATRHLFRTTTMALGAGLYIVWCAANVVAILIPPGWRPAELLAATVVMGAAGLLFQSRANALAEAAAPHTVRGRYLAAFQYSFTVPGIIAPAVVALFSVAIWLPWLLVAACSGLAILGLRWLASQLPERTLRPEPHVEEETIPSSA